MAPKPPSSDDQNPAPADDPELTKKRVLEAVVPLSGAKGVGAPPDDDKDDEEDETGARRR